jgi:hypothetical protein
MTEQHLTAFLISFSLMFTAHYMLEPTWRVGEKKSSSVRMIFNYSVGTAGIACAFLYLHMELWLDLAVCVAGAGSATVMAHSRDWLTQVIKRDRANGLIEKTEDEA